MVVRRSSLILAGCLGIVLAPMPAAAQTGPVQIPFSDRCLSPQGGVGADGKALKQFVCNGSAAQDFTINVVGDGFELAHVASGLCVQSPNNGVRRAELLLSACDQNPHAVFQATPGTDGTAQLALQATGLCADVFRRRTGNGVPIVLRPCIAPGSITNQSFALPEAAPVSGPILTAQSQKCLTPIGGGTQRGTRIVQSECTGADNQVFETTQSGTILRLKHATSGYCLSLRGRNNGIGRDFVLFGCDRQTSQFGVIPTQGGRVQISSTHNAFCIGIANGATANNAAIVQQDCVMEPEASTLAAQEFTLPGLARGDGEWDGPFTMEVVPVAAAALPDGKVLTWSAYGKDRFGGDQGKTYTSVFDPATGTATEELISHTGHDMFCPGISMLADGDYLISGGSSNHDVTRYTPGTNTFTAMKDMILGRGYHASGTLPNGNVFTVGGSWEGGLGNKYGETYSVASDDWVPLNGIVAESLSTDDPSGIYRADNHMWLFAAPNGDMFKAGPATEMHYINTDGTGTFRSAGIRSPKDSMNGAAAMYDIGKIYVAGGSRRYDKGGSGRVDAWTIELDENSDAVTVAATSDMAYERTILNSVILPSGEVVVLGGQAYAILFTDDFAVLAPEIWNPSTGRHTLHPPMEVPRTYHSTALLLKDGRVWAGGGGLCGHRGCTTNHPDAEIFTPPYLLNPDGSLRDRPVIGAAPASATHGETIRVHADVDVTEFVLMRLGSATHSLNTDQRRVPVDSAKVSVTGFDITIPSNPGIVVPGNYYLFAMTADGVPSEAVTVNIQ